MKTWLLGLLALGGYLALRSSTQTPLERAADAQDAALLAQLRANAERIRASRVTYATKEESDAAGTARFGNNFRSWQSPDGRWAPSQNPTISTNNFIDPGADIPFSFGPPTNVAGMESFR